MKRRIKISSFLKIRVFFIKNLYCVKDKIISIKYLQHQPFSKLFLSSTKWLNCFLSYMIKLFTYSFTYFSRLFDIIIIQFQMLELNEEQLKKTTRLQTKNCGISTKNYVAHQVQSKKWLKVKQCLNCNREILETFYYNSVFPQLLRQQNRPSLLYITDLSVRFKPEDAQSKEKQIVYFYIQRPLYLMSLKQLLQTSKQTLQQLPQIFKLFLQNSEDQLPLLVPSNIMLKKLFNKKISFHVNTTSIVGFQFFIEKREILASKFLEMSCYLHPKIFDFEGNLRLNICFETKLYQFAMIVLSLALNREIIMPSPASIGRSHTVKVIQLQGILDRQFQKIKEQLLGRRITWDRIKQNISRISKKVKIKGEVFQMQLSNFFKKIFNKNTSKKTQKQYKLHIQNHSTKQCTTFQSWIDVVRHFNDHFLNNYVQKQSKQSQQLMRDLFQNEQPSKIEFYKKMGIVHPQLEQNEDIDIKELVIYFMLKTNDFQQISNLFFDNVKQKSYRPIRYQKLKQLRQEVARKKERAQEVVRKKKLVEELLKNKEQVQQQQQFLQKKEQERLDPNCQLMGHNSQSQQFEIPYESEIQQSLNYNVFSYELQQNEESGKKTIYAPNEYQKTLDLFRNRIWF